MLATHMFFFFFFPQEVEGFSGLSGTLVVTGASQLNNADPLEVWTGV